MTLNVNVVCRNFGHDRVLPRFSRYLRDGLDWTLTKRAEPDAAVVYLMGYFEAQKLKPWPSVPVAAYFTHYEEEPPGNGKARYFDEMADRLHLRIATAPMYEDYLSTFGATVRIKPPVERDRFTIPNHRGHPKMTAGFSGYTYSNHRKGEDLVHGILGSKIGQSLEWKASGRKWPVPTKGYAWPQMPRFFQSLDVLVVTSRVEGVPMPPLEALSCGVSVVIPRGVGLLDELPDIVGVHRYEKGDVAGLVAALEDAVSARASVNREELRASTEPYSVKGWCQAHALTFERLLDGEMQSAGIKPMEDQEMARKRGRVWAVEAVPPVDHATGSSRGIYCVAFGERARSSCKRMMESAKKHMPDIPIALCAVSGIGPEDVLLLAEDSDIGGRRAKLRVYDLAPAEWDSILYLDADIEITAPVYQYFGWLDDGWQMAICKDIYPNDVLGHIRAKIKRPEAVATMAITGTWDVLQFNGGAWSFRRCDDTAAFFLAWRQEWEKWGQRDQGALIRAIYSHPLKLLLLGNEWNTFPKFQPDQKTAGVLHYPGEARRWGGQIVSRLDEPAAWDAVRHFEARRAQRG